MKDSYEALVARLDETYGPHEGRRLVAVAPGRSEVAGNHTDHEGGHVIAGAVTRYATGVFCPNGLRTIRLASEGYEPLEVELGPADGDVAAALAPREDERNTTTSLVRGLAALFAEKGFAPAGFDAVVTSDVPAGSGLSSSAAFELLVAVAMNTLWADDELSPIDLAKMAQRAENHWFGKPCGLMDQASVALGGLQHMGFYDKDRVEVEPLDFDFADAGYALCLVAVGADHAANTSDYAAVPAEMQHIAGILGAERLGEVCEADVIARAGELRIAAGDRPVLRALHYFREERLVEQRAAALHAGDVETFCRLTCDSGASSAMFLQNVAAGVGVAEAEQPAMVALGVAAELLQGRGAFRIHGGGFGGTIQAFVPLDLRDVFVSGMDGVFGDGATTVCDIDHEGAHTQWL